MAGGASSNYTYGYQYCTSPSQYQYCSTSTSTTTTTNPTTTSTSSTTTTTVPTTTTSSTTTTTTTTKPPACVYTPGYYKNHPAVVASVIAGSGGTIKLGSQKLTASQAQAVLSATPSKHPGVTFSSNSVLTLAQQVLTAELNIARGAVASASVQNALAQANAGLNVTVVGGTVGISTSLSASQVNALISTLTRFNEGRSGPGSCKS